MFPKSGQQSNGLIKRTKLRCVIVLGFLFLFLCFGIRLAITESPNEWNESDITVADVQLLSLRFSNWQITDIEGNRYIAKESDDVMDQILLQGTYHIVYSPERYIRAITQGNTVIVDYAHSVSVYCERDIWDWLLAFLGITGAITTIVCMIVDIRKEMSTGNSFGEK